MNTRQIERLQKIAAWVFFPAFLGCVLWAFIDDGIRTAREGAQYQQWVNECHSSGGRVDFVYCIGSGSAVLSRFEATP